MRQKDPRGLARALKGGTENCARMSALKVQGRLIDLIPPNFRKSESRQIPFY